MRRHSLPLAALSRLGWDSARWLMAYGGSGFSCCLFVIGAFYGLYRGCGLPFAPVLPAPWEALCASMGEVAAALLLAAASHVVLLSLAACSARLRQVLAGLTALLAEIPGLCLLGLACALFPSFWALTAVAAFSLIARSVHATLRAGSLIPSEFLKTARALRLGRWQGFWRLHVPFAFPELVRSVLRDLPDFWLRLLGGGMVMALLHPAAASGMGGAVLLALRGGRALPAAGLILLTLLLVALVQHGLITPLLGHGRRYAVCDLSALNRDEQEGGHVSQWWRHHALPAGLAGAVLAGGCLSWGLWSGGAGWPALLEAAGYPLAALLLVGLFWGVAGGLALGLRARAAEALQQGCLLLALCPVFLLFPVLPGWLPPVTWPGLACLGLAGRALLVHQGGEPAHRLVRMGQQLRLPGLSLWQHVRFPLLCPALLQAAVITLPFFWDVVLLAVLFGTGSGAAHSGSLLLSLLRGHDYARQGLFLCLMTLLAAATRRGVCLPLQERMARRYRV